MPLLVAGLLSKGEPGADGGRHLPGGDGPLQHHVVAREADLGGPVDQGVQVCGRVLLPTSGLLDGVFGASALPSGHHILDRGHWPNRRGGPVQIVSPHGGSLPPLPLVCDDERVLGLLKPPQSCSCR